MEFVDTQLKVAKDGIGTIVMLGEQIGIDQQIFMSKSEMAKFEQEKITIELEKEILENADNEISPNAS